MQCHQSLPGGTFLTASLWISQKYTLTGNCESIYRIEGEEKGKTPEDGLDHEKTEGLIYGYVPPVTELPVVRVVDLPAEPVRITPSSHPEV